MTRTFSTLVAAFALLTAVPAFAADAAATDDKAVVARINGEALTKADVTAEMAQLPPQLQQVPMQAIYPQLLEQLIIERTVQQAGYKAGVDKDDVVKKRLKDAEGKIVADEYLHQQIKKHVTDDMLKSAYEDYKKNFKGEEEVRASHILLKTEAEANDVIKQLKGGADFAKLAAEKSEDKAAAKQGGDLGYFHKADMVPSFADAAFSMKPGDVSQKPVKSDFGWHVIKVVDKRTSQPESFDAIKPQLENKLSQTQAQAIVKDLTAKAKIERFQLDGSPLPAPAEKASEKPADKPAAAPAISTPVTK